MKVSDVSTMREMDRTAIEQYGISDELLMENAGGAAARVIMDNVPPAGRRFVIFCGMGNNGGDGFVVARKLHSNHAKVVVYLLGDPDKYKGAARLNYEILQRIPVRMERISSAGAARSETLHADAVVDGIFGTGLTRDVEGMFADVVELINDCGKPVFALDIPSGVNGDTGRVHGVAVRADATVTFGLPKLGNMLYPGFDLCGTIHVTHISFPLEIHDADTVEAEINEPSPLPRRNPAGHKGSFGQALFVAGARAYFGAPGFAAQAFMLAGGGYARLAAPKGIVPHVATRAPEIVFHPQEETDEGAIALANEKALLEVAGGMDMVVVGPGMSLDEEAQELVRRLCREIPVPLLIDGDGITAVADDPDAVRSRGAATVLTPHPGEMARLTGRNVGEVLADPVGMVRRLARELRTVVVLKIAHSLVATPQGGMYINMSGNSGMGSAGTGDVLTGTIAAMHCLGLPFTDAVRKGVFIHGFAGDLAAESLGEDGITARDVAGHLPLAMRMDREGIGEPFASKYAGVRVV
ncbi:MAG: NAD(P)H-hydrate dehydratase [Desulfatibacillaceae bacterium]